MSYTVLPNQSLSDVVLAACGTLEAAYAVCQANNLPLSASVAQGTLSVGQQIIIPTTDASGNPVPTNNSVIAILAASNNIPATDNRLVCGLITGLGETGTPTTSTISIVLHAGANFIPYPGNAAQVTINTVDAPGSTLIGLSPIHPGSDICTYTFTGLTHATTYHIYARTLCDPGSTPTGYSLWVKIVANTI